MHDPFLTYRRQSSFRRTQKKKRIDVRDSAAWNMRCSMMCTCWSVVHGNTCRRTPDKEETWGKKTKSETKQSKLLTKQRTEENSSGIEKHKNTRLRSSTSPDVITVVRFCRMASDKEVVQTTSHHKTGHDRERRSRVSYPRITSFQAECLTHEIWRSETPSINTA